MTVYAIIPAGEITNSQINSNAAIDRSKLALEVKTHTLSFLDWRVWDALQTHLPTTAATDDLGFIPGTFGTNALVIRTSDSKNTSVTQRARTLTQIPYNYDMGQPLSVVAYAGMNTTVASSSATIDFEVYKHNLSTGLVGSDLVTTAATTINSLTLATKTFTIDPTGLVAGDLLDIRMTIAITDVATATAVIGQVGQVYMAYSVRG